MTQGRKPKPPEVHVLEGTFRRDRHGKGAKAQAGLPDCPGHLDAEAQAEWNRLAAELSKLGILATIDRAVLAAFCQVYSRWVRAEQEIAATGPVIRTASGEARINPWVRIADEAVKTLRQLAAELGLSPSARTRVRPQPQQPTTRIAVRQR